MAEAYQNRYWLAELFDRNGIVTKKKKFSFKYIRSSNKKPNNPRSTKKKAADLWVSQNQNDADSIRVTEGGKKGKWIQQVRRNGHYICISHKNKSNADNAAQDEESQIRKFVDDNTLEASTTTISQLLWNFYNESILDKHNETIGENAQKSYKTKLSNINVLLKQFKLSPDGADRTLLSLTSQEIEDYALNRVRAPNLVGYEKPIKSQTLLKILRTLAMAIDHSGIFHPEGNPARVVIKRLKEKNNKKFVKKDEERDRRFFPGEFKLFLKYALESKSEEIHDVIVFAVESCARRSEYANAIKDDFRIDNIKGNRTIMYWRIPESKTDNDDVQGREIPLSSVARKIVESRLNSKDTYEPLFSISPDSMSQAFDRIYSKVLENEKAFYKEVKKIHKKLLKYNREARHYYIPRIVLHDCRHEGLSRLFDTEKWRIEQVATISGHRDWKTLKRYVHLDDETVAKKVLSCPGKPR